MNYNLVNVSAMELKNSELKTNLDAMVAAEAAQQSGTWAFAFALNEIISNELYKADFEKKGKFAKAVGLSAGRISQCVGAVEFIIKHAQFTCMTVENAYLVGSLAIKENGKKVNKTEEFLDSLDSKNINVEALTTAQLKELIKKFKEAYGKEVVDADTQEAEAQEAEAQEADTQEADTQENKVPMLIGIGYVAETGQYIVKDNKGSQIVCNQPKVVLKTVADYFGISIEMIDDSDLNHMEAAQEADTQEAEAQEADTQEASTQEAQEEKPKTRKGAKARK